MKRKYLILATVCLVMTSCSTNSQQATTSQEPVTTPVDVQEEVVSEVKPEVKELPSNSLTATGKVKAANYTDLYFRSQELIAHVYVNSLFINIFQIIVGKGSTLFSAYFHSNV